MQTDLWTALLSSKTFWSEVVVRGGLIVLMFACLIAFLWVLRRRGQLRRPASLLSDERGSWMVEFILLVPIMTMFFVVMGQMVVLMRTALVVHYSAYSAARSARVHMPNMCGSLGKLDFSFSEECGTVGQFLGARPVSSDYHEIAEYAARKALISASPVNKRLQCWSAGACEVPAYFDKIAFADQLKGSALIEANKKRAEYAFDPQNLTLEPLIFGELSRADFESKEFTLEDGTRVAAKLAGPEIALVKGENNDEDLGYPVTARLTFRANLMFPYFSNRCVNGKCLFGAKKGKDSSGNNRYYSEIYAEVTVY